MATVEQVIQDALEATGARSASELSKMLGRKESTIAVARHRNSLSNDLFGRLWHVVEQRTGTVPESFIMYRDSLFMSDVA